MVGQRWPSDRSPLLPPHSQDGNGVGGGYGGGGDAWSGPRDFTGEEYGPGGNQIDTDQPFTVSVSFPVSNGQLKAMDVELSQGSNAPITFTVDDYDMDELSVSLAAGMTPTFSYVGAPPPFSSLPSPSRPTEPRPTEHGPVSGEGADHHSYPYVATSPANPNPISWQLLVLGGHAVDGWGRF